MKTATLTGIAILLFSSAAPASPDAGLNLPFQMPPAVTGATLDVTDFGATPDDDSDDDAIAINVAIEAASSGDEVYLPLGVYNTKSLITARSGITIRGESGKGTVIRARFNTTGQETLTVPSGRSNITIRDLTLDSDGPEAPRFTMQVGRNSGSLTQRVHLLNLTINTFRERAIILRTTRHVKIENCTISGATAFDGGEGYGITIQQPGGDNNWVTGCTLGPAVRHGILLQYSTSHNLIEKNLLRGNTEDAIDLHGEDEFSNEVRLNTIIDCDRSAIGIGNTGSTHDAAGPNNWIHSNTIRHCKDGIELIEGSDDQFIMNNDIRFCADYGIRLTNFAFMDPIENATITGNMILDCKRGISVEVSAPNLFVDGNIVTDNSVVGIVTSAAVTGYTITNNDFSCNGRPAQLGSAAGMYHANTETGACNLPVGMDSFTVH
jgi:parallel beta-helix repeat protein